MLAYTTSRSALALHRSDALHPILSKSFAPAKSQPCNFFPAGAEIYAQGEKAGSLYQVEFGAVRIYRLLTDGRRQISAFHMAGEIFGFEADDTHHFFAEAICATGIRSFRLCTRTDISDELLPLALARPRQGTGAPSRARPAECNRARSGIPCRHGGAARRIEPDRASHVPLGHRRLSRRHHRNCLPHFLQAPGDGHCQAPFVAEHRNNKMGRPARNERVGRCDGWLLPMVRQAPGDGKRQRKPSRKQLCTSARRKSSKHLASPTSIQTTHKEKAEKRPSIGRSLRSTASPTQPQCYPWGFPDRDIGKCGHG